MRKEFNNILRWEFTNSITANAGFSKMTERSPYVFPNELVFEKIVRPDFARLFVIMAPDPKREAFGLEIGWSAKGRFPKLSPRPSGSPTPNRTEFKNAEFICRLGDLYEQPGNLWFIQPDIDPFKDDFLEFVKNSVKPISQEEAASLVVPLVVDATSKLMSFGIPYLNEYLCSIGEKGLKLS